MAFFAVFLDGEGVLVIVAGTAGCATFHLGHGAGLDAGLEREYLGVAVGTLVHAGMDFVAEFRFAGIGLEGNRAGFEVVVALVATAGGCEGILAVVAGAAGFPFVHVRHGVVRGTGLVREHLGVAIFAAVHAGMDFVAEGDVGDSLYLEADVLRFHPSVAVTAIAGHGERLLPVMAGATGLPFFHLCHGDVLIPAGDHLAVVATFALAASLGYMDVMAEYHITKTFYLEIDVPGFTFMAADTIFLVGDAKGLYPGMAGTARLCFFHFRHGEALVLF